jgi:hypothetical protein
MAALRWARSVRCISASEKLVLLLLADAGNDHGEAWPSALSLADDACLWWRDQRARADRPTSGRDAFRGDDGCSRTADRGLYRFMLLALARREETASGYACASGSPPSPIC